MIVIEFWVRVHGGWSILLSLSLSCTTLDSVISLSIHNRWFTRLLGFVCINCWFIFRATTYPVLYSRLGILSGLCSSLRLFATDLDSSSLIIILADLSSLNQVDTTLLKLNQVHLNELIQILLGWYLRLVTDTVLAFLHINTNNYIFTMWVHTICLTILLSSLMNTIVST